MVLVILAILAAILVPTLIGYIDKARSEKDFATAQTVRVAAQASIDEAYGKGVKADTPATKAPSLTDETGTLNQGSGDYGTLVYTLSGVSKSDVTAFSFGYTNGAIDLTKSSETVNIVTINTHTYYLGKDGNWSSTKPTA